MKIKFLALKSSILIAVLGLLGFTSCGDDDDIHPEYGVKIVRDQQVKQQQAENDAIINENQNISETKN
ncbi:MAG: hypothetical protein C0596_18870 [Marinilabiliales bacterium]|nr:MAG: hypothetical protein C0596_18870 [Marinilabiliales bacterium]